MSLCRPFVIVWSRLDKPSDPWTSWQVGMLTDEYLQCLPVPHNITYPDIKPLIKITDPEMAEKWGFLRDESSHILYLTDISATLLLLLLGDIYLF